MECQWRKALPSIRKSFFYQEASTALEQVVESPPVVVLRAQLCKSSDVTWCQDSPAYSRNWATDLQHLFPLLLSPGGSV